MQTVNLVFEFFMFRYESQLVINRKKYISENEIKGEMKRIELNSVGLTYNSLREVSHN